MTPNDLDPEQPACAKAPCRLTVIKDRAQFLAARTGRRAVTDTLMLQWHAGLDLAEQDGRDRLVHVGFTATKKIGGAVIRNRAKRRLREAARVVLPKAGVPGTLYVLIARAQTAGSAYNCLLGDLGRAVERVHRDRRSKKPADRS